MSETELEAASAARRPRNMSDQPGWDALIEDIFGLSVRGLKTIWDMMVRPAQVLEAGRTRHWLDRYTPSLRLVMSLIAVMLLLRVFWAAEDTAMFQSILLQLEAVEAQGVVIEDANETARLYFNAWAFAFPIVYLLVHTMIAMVTRVWGKGTSFVVRLRLYYAAIIPALLFSVLSMAALPLLPIEFMLVFTAVSMFIAIAISWLTLFRGLAPDMGVGARIWRAVLFAVLVTMADVVTSVGSTLLGGIAVGYVSAGGSLPFLD